MKEALGGLGSSDMYYAQGNQAAQLARMPTMKERLELAVKQAEAQLARVTEARELLDRNPDLERLLDLLQQAHF